MWKRFISAARAEERIRVVPTRVISPPCGRRAEARQECPGGRLPRVVVAMEVQSPELLLPHGHRWQCWTGLQGRTTGATAQRGGFVGSPQTLQAVLFCLPESFLVFKDNSRVPFKLWHPECCPCQVGAAPCHDMAQPVVWMRTKASQLSLVLTTPVGLEINPYNL